jgi:hypothetical protein
MSLMKWVLYGGAGYLGYKMLVGKAGAAPGAVGGCSADQIKLIAGIYGMPTAAIGVRAPTAAGASGGFVIFDKRNGAGMMHVLSGNCNQAVNMATTAVAQAAGNRAFATKPYDGSLFVVS